MKLFDIFRAITVQRAIGFDQKRNAARLEQLRVETYAAERAAAWRAAELQYLREMARIQQEHLARESEVAQ